MYLFNLEALTAYTDIVSSDVLARFCSYFVTVFLPNKNIFVTHPLTGVLNNATGRILHRTVIGGMYRMCAQRLIQLVFIKFSPWQQGNRLLINAFVGAHKIPHYRVYMVWFRLSPSQ